MTIIASLVLGIEFKKSSLFEKVGERWECRNGHAKAKAVKFCDECGEPVVVRPVEKAKSAFAEWVRRHELDPGPRVQPPQKAWEALRSKAEDEASPSLSSFRATAGCPSFDNKTAECTIHDITPAQPVDEEFDDDDPEERLYALGFLMLVKRDWQDVDGSLGLDLANVGGRVGYISKQAAQMGIPEGPVRLFLTLYRT